MKENRGPWQQYFSCLVAAQYGIGTALVMRYVVEQVSRATVVMDGIQWFRSDFESMCRELPYLRKNYVRSALDTLITAGLIQSGVSFENVKLSAEWLSASPQATTMARSENIRIDVRVAVKLGLPAAVLLEELRFRAFCNLKRKPPTPWVKTRIRKAWNSMGLAETDHAKALASLVASQYVVSHPSRSDRVRLTTTDNVVGQAERRARKQSLRETATNRGKLSGISPEQARAFLMRLKEDE